MSYGAAPIDPTADAPDKPTADAANPDAPVKKDASPYPRAGRWGDKAYSDRYNPRALARTRGRPGSPGKSSGAG